MTEQHKKNVFQLIDLFLKVSLLGFIEKFGLDTHLYPFILFIVFMLQIMIVLLSKANYNNNKIVKGIIMLTCLSSWQLLLISMDYKIIFKAAVIIGYLLMWGYFHFYTMLVYQNSKKKLEKKLGMFFGIIFSISALISIYLNNLQGLVLLVQFILNVIILLIAMKKDKGELIHYLKNNRDLYISSTVVSGIFIIVIISMRVPDESILLWIIILYYMLSILYNILRRSLTYKIMGTPFTTRELGVILIFIVIISVWMLAMMNFSLEQFYYICFIVLLITKGIELCYVYNKKKKNNISHEGIGLELLKKEEELKESVANYLHDDILQDILALKNFLARAESQKIRNRMDDIFSNLIKSIRGEMEQIHPVLLDQLSLKSNYKHLIETNFTSSEEKLVQYTFICSDNFSIPKPYDIIIYRIIRELTINIIKHSQADKATVSLNRKNNCILLSVADNGIGMTEKVLDINKSDHRGLVSIKEKVEALGGSFIVRNNQSEGFVVMINIPIEGGLVYEYFINR